MGLLDFLRSYGSQADEPTLSKRELSAVAEAVYAEIEARRAAFGIEDAMKLPPVIRGVNLITSLGATFLPLVYREGQPLSIQPRIVSKPNPFQTRPEFLSHTLRSLVRDGCAYWWHPAADRDPETGKPRQAHVLVHDEVQVQWDERRLRPLYSWRGMTLVLGQDLTHIAINRLPGDLHGHSPIRDGLDYLSPIAAAEDYARDYFTTGGMPPVVIRWNGGELSTEQSDTVKQRWMETRSVTSSPAVIGKDFDLQFPQVNPQTGQMQESRSYGAAVVARILGIPAPLMLAETSGSLITYQNASSALEDLVKSTILPQYLVPIEAAWSDLVPNTQSVRFDLRDMDRVSMADRVAIYKELIPLGIITAPEARANEGWGPAETDSSHAFDPVPSEEVPA